MFIGIDHGTMAMRFVSTDGRRLKIPRREAVAFTLDDLYSTFPRDEIEGIAITYSMGDNFSVIMPATQLKNRGLVSREGAGEHTGGGTRVFDVITGSGIPTIAIPGLHRNSSTDPRFKIYSHQSSPEKIGIAYGVVTQLGPDCVVCDVSSNTVTLLVRDGRIVGGLDACVFAPGWVHGALDLDAIRSVDHGDTTANEAFLHAGVSEHLSEELRLPALAMFAAMEIAGLRLLAPAAPVAICGSRAPDIAEEVSVLLRSPVLVLDEWSAASGLAAIAEAVSTGTDMILGIPVFL